MLNFTTNKNYQGSNLTALSGLQYNKVSKKKEKKKVPVYFNVFEKNHLVSVIQKNKI